MVCTVTIDVSYLTLYICHLLSHISFFNSVILLDDQNELKDKGIQFICDTVNKELFPKEDEMNW